MIKSFFKKLTRLVKDKFYCLVFGKRNVAIVSEAIDYCIKNNILADVMENERDTVMVSMLSMLCEEQEEILGRDLMED